MLFGLSWRACAMIGIALIVVACVAGAAGALKAWDARGRLAAAERAAEIEALNRRAAEMAAELARVSADLAARTQAAERAIARTIGAANTEIADAAAQDDGDALYRAWASARERVWADAGFAPAAPADSGAGRPAPGLRVAGHAAA